MSVKPGNMCYSMNKKQSIAKKNTYVRHSWKKTPVGDCARFFWDGLGTSNKLLGGWASGFSSQPSPPEHQITPARWKTCPFCPFLAALPCFHFLGSTFPINRFWDQTYSTIKIHGAVLRMMMSLIQPATFTGPLIHTNKAQPGHQAKWCPVHLLQRYQSWNLHCGQGANLILSRTSFKMWGDGGGTAVTFQVYGQILVREDLGATRTNI